MMVVLKSGGKQYKCSVGDVIIIEKPKKSDVGLKFSADVLCTFSNGVAQFKDKKTAELEILENIKDDKKIIFKMERRTTNKKKNGHRQKLAKVKINSIS